MTSMPPLEEDLARWEAGDLTRAELEARWPGTDLGGLLDLRSRLAAVADLPVGDPNWEALEERLDRPSEPSPIGRKPGARRSSFRRVAVLAAASLFMGGAAFAAQPGTLGDQLEGVWQGALSLLGTDEHGPDPATRSGDGATSREEKAGGGHGQGGVDERDDDRNQGAGDEGGDDQGRGGGDEGEDDQSDQGDEQDSEGDEPSPDSEGDPGDEGDDPNPEGDDPNPEGDDPNPEGGDDPESDQS